MPVQTAHCPATSYQECEYTKYWLFDLLDSVPTPHTRLYTTLLEAGYTRIHIERLPSHPVWQIRATLPLNAPVDRRVLKRQIRALLKEAHLPVKADGIVVMPAGRRLHISFVQEAGRGVVMHHGVATLVEDNDPDPVVEYDD